MLISASETSDLLPDLQGLPAKIVTEELTKWANKQFCQGRGKYEAVVP